MKITLKSISALVLIILATLSLYLMNLFSKKPISLDHYLGMELVLNILDSPEYMTYLGIFDNFAAVFGHNRKLSISSLEDAEKNYKENLERLEVLRGFEQSKLDQNQKITLKIAIFDTEMDIERYEKFRYHTYPFNQISGNHLNLVEFMTDTHPVRNEREASDYIERVKMFDDALNANLIWLEEQKKLGIFAPKYVFDHVIRQLNEFLTYKDYGIGIDDKFIYRRIYSKNCRDT